MRTQTKHELINELNTVIDKIIAEDNFRLTIGALNEATNKLIVAVPYNIDTFKIFNKWEHCQYGGFRLGWSGETGFGQYDVVNNTELDERRAGYYMSTGKPVDPTYSYELKVSGDSECMDDNENKSFLKVLLLKLINEIDIED